MSSKSFYVVAFTLSLVLSACARPASPDPIVMAAAVQATLTALAPAPTETLARAAATSHATATATSFPPTATPTPTPTSTSTATPTIPPTPLPTQAPTETHTPAPAARVRVNANLRAGPGTDFAIIGRSAAGETVRIKARSADGQWYQLVDGAWIFAPGIENPPDPATMQANAGASPVAPTRSPTLFPTKTPTGTPRPLATATRTLLPTKTPTGTPRPSVTATRTPIPTTTLTSTVRPTPLARLRGNANLRAGPGTQYPIVRGIAAGEGLDIRARSADNQWYQLADGAWISAQLVVNPPNVVVVGTEPAPTPSAASDSQATALDAAGWLKGKLADCGAVYRYPPTWQTDGRGFLDPANAGIISVLCTTAAYSEKMSSEAQALAQAQQLFGAGNWAAISAGTYTKGQGEKFPFVFATFSMQFTVGDPATVILATTQTTPERTVLVMVRAPAEVSANLIQEIEQLIRTVDRG